MRAIGLTLIVVLMLLVSGCASRQETIQSLTQDESERMALQEFSSEYPDMADRDSMQAYLGGMRQAQRRRQALMIQFRQQYPKATPEELQILIEDQMGRDAAAMFPAPIDCTSMRFGNMVNTSCY